MTAKLIVILILFFAVWNLYKKLNPPRPHTSRKEGPGFSPDHLDGKDVSDGEFKEVNK